MGPEINALYISYVDPSSAVIYDREWLIRIAQEVGLVISDVIPPQVRHHQWTLVMRPVASGAQEATWPVDKAPIGKVIPPKGVANPHLVQ